VSGTEHRDPGGTRSVTEWYGIRERDVLVIGSGGAGLRAAIGCCGSGGISRLGLQSLLGKAHMLMPREASPLFSEPGSA